MKASSGAHKKGEGGDGGLWVCKAAPPAQHLAPSLTNNVKNRNTQSPPLPIGMTNVTVKAKRLSLFTASTQFNTVMM